MPQEDSVSWADEYTLFTVIRSTNNESITIPLTTHKKNRIDEEVFILHTITNFLHLFGSAKRAND